MTYLATPMQTLLSHLDLLSDATRCRVLCAAESNELTVGELCLVLEMPQSTVSRHLKQLSDLGWVQVRQEGSRRFYRVELDRLAAPERRLWLLLRNELDQEDGDFRGDQQRLQRVLSDRRSTSDAFFQNTASEWEGLRRELFGDRFDLLGLLNLLDASWVVGDLGCGTGSIASTLAPFVDQVIAVDASAEMLEMASRNVEGAPNVQLRSGDLEQLPIENETLDIAILFLVLQYTASPKAVLAEAQRVLKPGGRLVVVDLMTHEDDALRARIGQQWQGFDELALRRDLQAAGLDAVRWVEIETQPKPKAKAAKLVGPAARLFSASATRPLAAAATRPSAVRSRSNETETQASQAT